MGYTTGMLPCSYILNFRKQPRGTFKQAMVSGMIGGLIARFKPVLTHQEWDVMNKLYGIECEPMSVRDCAASCTVHRSRIYMIHQHAMDVMSSTNSDSWEFLSAAIDSLPSLCTPPSSHQGLLP